MGTLSVLLKTKRLFQSQQAFYKINMSFGNCTIQPQVAFTFFRFFRQYVTLETLLMHDLSGCRYFKALFGTGICFYFRHFTQYYNDTLEAFPTGGSLSNLFRKCRSLLSYAALPVFGLQR